MSEYLNAQCLNTQQDLASLCPINMWHSGIEHSGAIWYPNHLNATLHVIKGAVIQGSVASQHVKKVTVQVFTPITINS